MSSEDQDALLTFARQLSEHDLLFLRRDITRAEVVAAMPDAAPDRFERHRRRRIEQVAEVLRAYPGAGLEPKAGLAG